MFVAQLNVATCWWRAATLAHLSGVSPGIGTGQLSACLEKDGALPAIAYVIPNTAVEIGESMTFISPVTVRW